jgi:type I restriction enzyme S subunit
MSKIPKLRFKEFYEEWEEKPLEKYGSLINGLTYSPDNIVENGLLVLRSSNIQNGQIAFEDNVYVNLDVAKEYLTQENDILICVRNGSKRLIGKSLLIPKDLPKSTHGAFMTVFRGDSNKFISHWLKTPMFFKEVHKNLGATINSINGSNLKKFKTFFPKKQEQEKIASFLTSVDTKIEQLTRKEELLQQYKKGVMQKIFSQEIRFSPKGTSSQAQGEADDGSEFCDWEDKKLGKISDVRDGTHDSPKYYEEGYPLITSKNLLSNGNIDFKNINLIMEEDYININKRSNVNIGDILFGMIGTIGNPVIVRSEDFAIKNVALIKEKEKLLNKFLIHYLKSSLIEKQFYEQNTGGTQKFIALGVIRNLIIKLPTLEEQNKIANFLSSIDNKIEQTGKQLEQTKEFKKALLQQMFV